MWWNDYSMKADPIDFAMCAHVFGVTSSASCENYSLRKTSFDNVREFEKNAARVKQTDFYLDYLLNLVEDLDTAYTLMKNFIIMCM